MAMCSGCEVDFEDLIRLIGADDQKALDFFSNHGVILPSCKCPKCDRECYLRKDGNIFYCGSKKINLKNKRIFKCDFSVSRFKNTWLANSHIPPNKNLRFINVYIRKFFSHIYALNILKLNQETVVNWESFCGEVCEKWMDNQQPIGGEGVIVDIDESHFRRSKYSWSCEVKGIWMFGGIERISKKKFILPVLNHSAETLVPLIQTLIKPGSVVISNCWQANCNLGNYGYIHKCVNQSEKFVDPEDHTAHTQNIDWLWKDIKAWVLQAGKKRYHSRKYFARYLFLSEHSNPSTVLHHFLCTIADLYPPSQDLQVLKNEIVDGVIVKEELLDLSD